MHCLRTSRPGKHLVVAYPDTAKRMLSISVYTVHGRAWDSVSLIPCSKKIFAKLMTHETRTYRIHLLGNRSRRYLSVLVLVHPHKVRTVVSLSGSNRRRGHRRLITHGRHSIPGVAVRPRGVVGPGRHEGSGRGCWARGGSRRARGDRTSPRSQPRTAAALPSPDVRRRTLSDGAPRHQWRRARGREHLKEGRDIDHIQYPGWYNHRL
jgi:hypothetical protein